MVELTAGKKLSAARLARGLTLDAVAHATKMRPDKILALESDDFTRFGSSSYAKSFLLMYSRFLNVDVAMELQDLSSDDHRVNIQEYQYLNNAPAPKEQERQPLHRRKMKPPSILPLVAFVVLCVLGGIGLYLKEMYNRLELGKPSEPPASEMLTQQKPAAPVPAVVPAPAEPAPAPAEAAPETPAPAETIAAVPAEPESRDNELSVESLKKTYVTIRKDRNSPALFEDYVYPNGKLLKIHGTTFFIEVRDETAVQIRKNGHPIAYQAPGIAVE